MTFEASTKCSWRCRIPDVSTKHKYGVETGVQRQTIREVLLNLSAPAVINWVRRLYRLEGGQSKERPLGAHRPPSDAYSPPNGQSHSGVPAW